MLTLLSYRKYAYSGPGDVGAVAVWVLYGNCAQSFKELKEVYSNFHLMQIRMNARNCIRAYGPT